MENPIPIETLMEQASPQEAWVVALETYDGPDGEPITSEYVASAASGGEAEYPSELVARLWNALPVTLELLAMQKHLLDTFDVAQRMHMGDKRCVLCWAEQGKDHIALCPIPKSRDAAARLRRILNGEAS